MHLRLTRPALALLLAVAGGMLLATAAAAQDCPNCGPQGRMHGHHQPRMSSTYYGQPGNPGYGGDVSCLNPRAVPTDLFYNYYIGGNCGSTPAAMYPAPYPSPLITGHTWYTYQPLLPHEYLYTHKRSYHTYYDQGRGLSRTHVHWGVRPVATAHSALRSAFEIAR